MAGHSKWAGIKHKKAIVDARRGKLFTKLARAITVAAKEGGGDIEGNPALGLAVQKARDASMPKDNIERAIAKGTGEGGDAEALEAVTYEGYGAGGVALLVEPMACGTPSVGPTAELYDRPGVGTAFAGDDPAELAATLEHAMAQADPRACRARAQDFSAERCAAAYERLYEESRR